MRFIDGVAFQPFFGVFGRAIENGPHVASKYGIEIQGSPPFF
jgi:hypothetical protein